MYNHEIEGYQCPFCAVRDGVEGDFPYTKQADIVFQNNDLMAIIASHGWETNPGHVILFPKQHLENIFDIPDDLLAKLHVFAKRVGSVMKQEYHCEGITIRQNNEPAGDQDVWHFHLHVFPRFTNDNINQIPRDLIRLNNPQQRVEYANRLKKYFQKN